MNKKTIKVLTVILLIAMMTTICCTVYAEGDILLPKDITGSKSQGQQQVQEIGNRIVGILQAIGVVVSVAILIVLGIKYMMGSAEEKAEYKKTFIPYIIGAALIFAASSIAGAVVNFITPK